MEYILFNKQMGGWLTAQGTYLSEWEDAMRVPERQAIAMAKRAYTWEMVLIPVRWEDMKKVVEE